MENLYINKKVLQFKNKNLDKLYKTLSNNQWIKISGEKYRDFDYSKKIKSVYDGEGFLKPPGSWFSKGTWLFFDLGMSLLFINDLTEFETDKRELIIITVDNNQIYEIKGAKPLINPLKNKTFNKSFKGFTKKYVKTQIGKDKCEFDKLYNILDTNKNKSKSKKNKTGLKLKKESCTKIKTKKKCHNNKYCFWNSKYNLYDFKKLYNDGYNGFSINPYPGSDDEYFNDVNLGFKIYDTESLALFNSKSVLSYHNIGSIGEIVKVCKGKKTVPKFINELCKRINQINNTPKSSS